uniref:Uncharacterized protein n=1 Tax=Anguilla anguilla TaxID=7936 RepID=A0A0E9S225_ANGAN
MMSHNRWNVYKHSAELHREGS